MYLGMSLQHAMMSCDFRRVRFGDEHWMLIGYTRATVRRGFSPGPPKINLFGLDNVAGKSGADELNKLLIINARAISI